MNISVDEECYLGEGNTENTTDRFGDLIERIRNQEDIPEKLKEALIDLIYKYETCFGTGYENLSQANLLKFHVDTGNAKPIYRRPYSILSNSEKQFLKKDLEDMVKNGLLIPQTHVPGNSSTSGRSFPCRYVLKKGGDKRLVTNFKDLNAVTIRDPWPLPNLVDVLESLAGAKWFAALDLLKAFQQIAVEKESIPKLTITTPWGNYSYLCIPFGVINGTACFSRCVYPAIQPFMNKFATNYLDDCTLYSKTNEEHLEHVELFLERLLEVNLKLNSRKCNFFQKEISLLGFVVNRSGISPSPAKVDKILNFPKPVNETEIRTFVNLCGFYRRHIPGFADLAAPMNELLKKRNPFIWSEGCDKPFNDLKQALSQAAILFIPEPDTNYNLYCDGSEKGIGAALIAVDLNGEEKPVSFLSRKLQSAEVRYPTVEKELLAVIYALKKLRKYLLDRKFTLFCDNTAVCYLFNKNEPSQRWVMCTQEFTFDVKHLSSFKNCVADALSHFSPNHGDDPQDGEDLIDDLFDHLLITSMEDQYEEWIQAIADYFKTPGSPDTSDGIKRLSLKYRYDNSALYRKVGQRFLIVPVIQDRTKVLNEVHEGHGHFGVNATWARLYSHYWGPYCYEELKAHIQSCYQCQMFSLPETNPPSGRVPIHYLFEQFSLDFVGPLPMSRSGNVHILVAVENFSRWPIAMAVPSTEAKVVSKFLYELIFCQFGLPTHILTDNASSFDNSIIEGFLNLVQVHHKFSAPYRPQTNGRVEQMNGNLMKSLKKLCIENPIDWDEHLAAVVYAYRD